MIIYTELLISVTYITTHPLATKLIISFANKVDHFLCPLQSLCWCFGFNPSLPVHNISQGEAKVSASYTYIYKCTCVSMSPWIPLVSNDRFPQQIIIMYWLYYTDSLQLCMYVCMYVRVCVCMYVCVCMCVCLCVYVYACFYGNGFSNKCHWSTKHSYCIVLTSYISNNTLLGGTLNSTWFISTHTCEWHLSCYIYMHLYST